MESRFLCRARFLGENALGAFADGAILFPLVAALCASNAFSSTLLLGSAGLAYIAAGILFRVPMSVQPLKAVAIAALTVGATRTEVRLSGALLGLFCLALSFLDVDRLAARVPRALVHGLQLGLGVLLLFQGAKFAPVPASLAWAAVSAFLIVILTARLRFPFLGLLASAGLLVALFAPAPVVNVGTALAAGTSDAVRWGIVATLVLPQIALTSANSVLGTMDVAARYFGERAKRVTARRLLDSIGVGNLLSALIGGLPYCHGSGGVTAHVKGGATHWISNLIIGGSLLAFAGAAAWRGEGMVLHYPPVLLALLLIATGLFHLRLAAPSWRAGEKTRLALMAATALLTRNMLWVLGAGLLPDLARAMQSTWLRRQPVHD